MEINSSVSLKNYNSWKVGGEAEFFCLPQTSEEVKEAILWAHEKDIPYSVLGGGTNVLVSDRGVRGLVICTKKLNGIEDISDDKTFRLKCLSGTLKFKVMRMFAKHDLPPALFLSGLPGDLGGGVVMNAGVGEQIRPREFVEVVESFKVLTKTNESIQELEYKNTDVNWEYRKSTGWAWGVVTEVVVSWDKDDAVSGLREKVLEAQKVRASKQPLDQPSCGSVFRNPEGHKAGALIEKAGLKGFEYGGAQVSRKHANFILNKDAATALDLHCLISLVKNKVQAVHSVELHHEVRYFGDWEGLI